MSYPDNGLTCIKPFKKQKKVVSKIPKSNFNLKKYELFDKCCYTPGGHGVSIKKNKL